MAVPLKCAESNDSYDFFYNQDFVLGKKIAKHHYELIMFFHSDTITVIRHARSTLIQQNIGNKEKYAKKQYRSHRVIVTTFSSWQCHEPHNMGKCIMIDVSMLDGEEKE